MKIKSIVILLLLTALSFSVMHEYVFTFYDTQHHHTANEYTDEISQPTSHGDMCDIHFEYHQPTLLSQETTLPKVQKIASTNMIRKEAYKFILEMDFFKPPRS